MKSIVLVAALAVWAGVIAFGQQANSSSKAATQNSASSEHKPHGKSKTVDVPVDIDITPDGNGNPTAADATLHRTRHEVAQWKNKMSSNCDVSFSPLAKANSNYHVLKGGKKASGPIVAPNGTYNYWISCTAKKKGSKPVKSDPAIIVTD
jgi:hypothetical protein